MSSVYCLEMHMLCTCHLYCCYLYMYMSSTYYLGIYVLCADYLKWSLISPFLTDNTNVIHTSSLVLYIFYYVQLSFCTLPTQMHIVHVICILSTHVHIICFSSLTLLVYPIIHNLVSAHCLHTHTHCPCHLHVVRTCTHHLLVISNTPCMPYYPQLSFRTYCLHTCTLSLSCVYCLQMHMLCTSHFYCCYLHMYMSSAYYLSICILCAHYLQWSLIYSFLTDNANVIHMSSLVLFIYPVMYNFVSAHCLHKCTLSMSSVCCPHMYMSFACHL